MKRQSIPVLVFILIMSLFSVVYAESSQIVSAIVEEPIGGSFVRVTVDVSDNLSVQFYPHAFYLYDQPFDPAADGAGEFLAYGTLFSVETYDSLLESLSEDQYEQKDGFIIHTDGAGMTYFYAPVDETVYIGLIIDPAVEDAGAVWARVACARVTFGK